MQILLHSSSYAQQLPSNPLRSFDLYYLQEHHNSPSKPLICFVHGGAWRSEDKSDWKNLARSLVSATRCPVAVPNYRLTPRSPEDGSPFRHPGHAEDILEFLNFILGSSPSALVPTSSSESLSSTAVVHAETDTNELSIDPIQAQGRTRPAIDALIPRVFHPENLLLIGHSCSAHMLSSIFLDSSKATPSLTPSSRLFNAVKGIIMSEGIYNLDKIIDRFPEYRGWFIEAAFGEPPYDQYSASAYPLRQLATDEPAGAHHIRWLVLHSPGDTLVDPSQSEGMYSHLSGLKVDVTHDFATLVEEHDDVLRGQPYVDLVKQFVFKTFDL